MTDSLLRCVTFVGLITVGCESTSDWQSEVAFEAGLKLGGCTVGDLNADQPGNEIAVVAEDGQVFVLAFDSEWQSEVAADFEGEMIQCAAGDLDTSHPGAELIVCGMLQGGEDEGGRGAAYCIRRGESGYEAEKILEDGALFHAVCIGDIHPAEGNELLLAGYSKKAIVLSYAEGSWKTLAEIGIPGRAKGACVGREGALIACEEGPLVHLSFAKGDGTIEELQAFPNALARLTCVDGVVAVCDNGGNFNVFAKGEKQATTVAVDSDRLRGAVIAELDSASVGLEWATAGYNGKICLVDRDGVARVLATDDNKFHHLASGELPEHGMCLVGCGYSGRVIVCFKK